MSIKAIFQIKVLGKLPLESESASSAENRYGGLPFEPHRVPQPSHAEDLRANFERPRKKEYRGGRTIGCERTLSLHVSRHFFFSDGNSSELLKF